MKDKFVSVWNNIKYSKILWQFDTSSSFSTAPIVILGNEYNGSTTVTNFMAGTNNRNVSSFRIDFISRIWLTYRRNFEAFIGTTLTSDCGWGCMIRSGQMLMANALLLKELGRQWRWSSNPDGNFQYNNNASESIHHSILRLFEDTPKYKLAPLSIHRLVSLAYDLFGLKAGDWFGPTNTSLLLQGAIEKSDNALLRRLKVYVAQQCTVYIQDILDLCDWSSLIILIPFRLGLDTPNKSYLNFLKKILRHETSVGIIGGRPKRSLYFIGFQEDDMIHLDPHVVQDHLGTLKTESFHCSSPRKTPFAQMDPSACAGFLFESRQQFLEWCADIKNEASYPDEQIFTVIKDRVDSKISSSNMTSERPSLPFCDILVDDDFVLV